VASCLQMGKSGPHGELSGAKFKGSVRAGASQLVNCKLNDTCAAVGNTARSLENALVNSSEIVCSKNVVLIAMNRSKMRTKGEQRRRK
jgi:hypothetical protein